MATSQEIEAGRKILAGSSAEMIEAFDMQMDSKWEEDLDRRMMLCQRGIWLMHEQRGHLGPFCVQFCLLCWQTRSSAHFAPPALHLVLLVIYMPFEIQMLNLKTLAPVVPNGKVKTE